MGQKEEYFKGLLLDATNSRASLEHTGCGRCMMARANIEAGSTILVSRPYVVIVNEECLDRVCANCFEYNGSKKGMWRHLNGCGHCFSAWYCSEKCKYKHFVQIHHMECPYLREFKAYIHVSYHNRNRIRLLIRLLLNRFQNRHYPGAKVGQAGSGQSVVFFDEEGVEMLFFNVNEALENELNITELIEIARTLIHPMYITETNAELKILISKLELNRFGIWSCEEELLGISLHPSASFFNHSCIPNCYGEWDGLELVFKALYFIPEGTELVISYIDSHQETEVRQGQLLDLYYFRCTCPRCVYDGLYPMCCYDAFYIHYLGCKKDSGLMRPICHNSNSADGREMRECTTCGSKRVLPGGVPPLHQYLQKCAPSCKQKMNNFDIV